MWTEELFGVHKPIIALLHLDALPGFFLPMNSAFLISPWRT